MMYQNPLWRSCKRLFASVTLVAVNAFVLAACASSPPPIQPTKTIVELPPLGEIAEKELGETLLTYYEEHSSPTFRITERIDTFIDVMPQLAVPIEVTPDYIFGRVVQGDNMAKGEVKYCYERATGRYGAVVMGCPPGAYESSGRMIEDVYVDQSFPRFEQELIYGGRSGDTLKFTYREFTSGMIRDAFSQPVEYDLKESNIVGYRGARLEIIEASNSSITYKVLSGFDR